MTALSPSEPSGSNGPRVSAMSSVVLEAQATSGVGTNVSLHPLPILNISEHLVRSRLQSGNDSVQVFGMLLGSQSGRDIAIQNSFEVQIDQEQPQADHVVDHAFLRSRQAQYKQVFPTLDIIGWYTVGIVPSAVEVAIHKQLLAYNETPLLLQLHPTVSSFEAADKDGELPISIYESVIELVSGEATTFFVPIGYQIETGEAERIAVDHTSKAGAESGGSDESSMVTSLMAQHSAISKLHDRINVVLRYVQGVKSGTIPRDEESLRQINAVVSNLPASGLDELHSEFLREYNDVLLTIYLSSLTKGLHSLNELVDKFDVVQSGRNEGELTGAAASRSGGGGRSRGARGNAMMEAVYG